MSVRAFLAFLAVLALVGLLAFGLLSKGSTGVELGEQAPAGALPRLEGKGTGSLADYRGRWVLVNFWASWCVPCREEARALNELQKARGGQDFTVVGIDSNDLSPDAKAFIKKYGVSYPQLRDPNGDLADDFGTTGVPESYLFNPQGKLAEARPGPVTATILRERFLPLIPQKGQS